MPERLILALAAASLALPAAGAAFAQGAVVPGSPEAGTTICKRMAQPNSRLVKRDCRTAAAWERLTEEHRRGASELIDRPHIFDCRSAGAPC